MEQQYPPHLRNGLRVLMRAVVRGNDQFTLRTLHVAAPVRDNAV
ncbi:MAG: hypothetical protein ACAI34_16485 [Verrucomicrobium sp.]|nr:hypothetical protein [Verrucomicrobium sp.]